MVYADDVTKKAWRDGDDKGIGMREGYRKDLESRYDRAPPDEEAASSPAQPEKSFMTNVTEDEDTRMGDGSPEPDERPRKKKKKIIRESTGRTGENLIGKIRHLKKEDGEPLWRKDIQYDFLKAVFDDEEKVFHNSYDPNLGRQCFADLYIDTMSRSSKTSKVLRDKLLSDREAAKGMAMVCLLVNIGRMNTTLNFFPEMRAQLRTYHAIPSLQAHQDAHAYKQLQDAPRLKSILKGGAEDRPEPLSLDAIKYAKIPRTNPVNLLFVICQSAIKIAELHFPPWHEFHDLITKTNFSSKSRAKAFLWLMWFYLESDFTEEGCEENPFGAGVDYGVDVANQGIPKLEELTPEDEALENDDPPAEVEFGRAQQRMRAKIIEADQQYIAENQTKRGGRGNRPFAAGEDGPSILPRIRPSKHDSDMDSVRSTPPPRNMAARHSSGAVGSSAVRRGTNPLKSFVFEGSSPGAHHSGAGGEGGERGSGIVARKPRPLTAHQLAVERNRSQRVNYILDRGLRREHHKARKARRAEGAVMRALHRLRDIQDPFAHSDEEDFVNLTNGKAQTLVGDDDEPARRNPYRESGLGGLCSLKDEEDDFGEEVRSYAAAVRRAERRLTRWENHEGEPLGVIPPIKKPRADNDLNDELDDEDDEGDFDASPSKYGVDPAETEDETELYVRPKPKKPARRKPRPAKTNGASSAAANGDGDVHMDDAEDLDDVEKQLLGIAEDDDEDDNNEDGDNDEAEDGKEDGEDDDGELDGLDKTLLGMEDGDSDTE